MTTKTKIGGITAASLATLICGTVGTNYVGNDGSGNVSVTYDQLVNNSSVQTEQTTLSEDTVEVTVYSTTTAHSTSALLIQSEATTSISTASITTPPSSVSTASTASASAVVTTTATEPVVIEDEITVTVYVSNSGKYHSKSNCSGMKSYTEMSLDEALGAGHVACKKCW